jgi:hypothetical protein
MKEADLRVRLFFVFDGMGFVRARRAIAAL